MENSSPSLLNQESTLGTLQQPTLTPDLAMVAEATALAVTEEPREAVAVEAVAMVGTQEEAMVAVVMATVKEDLLLLPLTPVT
jgi:hypothetical protein